MPHNLANQPKSGTAKVNPSNAQTGANVHPYKNRAKTTLQCRGEYTFTCCPSLRVVLTNILYQTDPTSQKTDGVLFRLMKTTIN